MFQDWEHLRNVIRQGIRREFFEIRNSSAIKYDKVLLSNVIRLGTVQRCNKKRYMS